jgi:hypothetical protein
MKLPEFVFFPCREFCCTETSPLKIRRFPIPGTDATKTFRTVRSADRPGSQTYLPVPLAGVNHFAPDSRIRRTRIRRASCWSATILLRPDSTLSPRESVRAGPNPETMNGTLHEWISLIDCGQFQCQGRADADLNIFSDWGRVSETSCGH